MALQVTPVNRNLQTRVAFMFLEFEDLFVVLGAAAVMNIVGHFVGGEIAGMPMNLVLQYGVPLIMMPVLMAFKYGKPRGYVTGWGTPNGTNMITALATSTQTAAGLLGLENEFCDSSGNCSADTISVTVNNTTEVINFGPNFGNDGTLSTITSLIASAFDLDPNSPVIANYSQDPFSIVGDGWDVFFTAKQAGIGGNYPTNLSVTCSLFCNASLFTAWTWTADARTGYAAQNAFTSSTPFSGSLTGGR